MRLMLTSIIAVMTATHAFAAAPAASAGGSAFPPFDSSTFTGQLFWLGITFGLVYYLMSRIAVPRIAGVIEQRRLTIESALAAANAAQKGAEESALALEQGLAKAKSNAQAIALEAKAKSSGEIDARRHQVEADLKEKFAAAEMRITATKTAAMGNVDDIAKEAVGTIIEQLTGKAPTADAIAKAIAGARN